MRRTFPFEDGLFLAELGSLSQFIFAYRGHPTVLKKLLVAEIEKTLNRLRKLLWWKNIYVLNF